MQKCATVEEVKYLISQYNINFSGGAVFRFVDKTGKYLYVDGDSLSIGDEDYFVQTNVRPYENKECWRLDKATRLLKNYYDADINYCKSIMDSVHQEKKWGGTIYSTIYDLNNGKIYLYYFYDFKNVISFDLKEELYKEDKVLNMPEMFPKNESGQKYFTEYNKILRQIKSLGDSLWTDGNNSYKAVKSAISNSFIDNYPFYYKISKLAEYYQLENINFPRAILLLSLNVEIIPNYWIGYYNLAEGYMKTKQYQLALDNYLRSVELNPNDTLSIKQIEYIKKLMVK
ncbi:MAG: tetratricopeptide repeat protein [bacterium]